ncbi:hypothetical protein VitviT2T_008399 [Vitis vinifera]|uniref:Uncharacterized protein n=2 Tax=Vitis vinifera TaxID=29760 RepID=A0ABY9C1Q8_VITVI|nr:uncharacterized protein LOC100251809 [Vitis vinifera]WJZ89160.1 hypothetical protein VitviT2T_008399 [Vitis vinifera]|eukprot:XP_003632127.1 PREDICTED: uncharacterized protein LOC100251809 [Vitis vinifera]
MNGMSNPTTDFMEGNGGGSDSDTNSEDSPEYYQPISAVDSDGEASDQVNSDEDHEEHASDFHRLPNGYCGHVAENGVSSLNLNDDVEEEHEEERMRETSDSAIRRAFREDESRRNAPLTPENAMQVMEAMRGVSFGGLAPDWAGHVPEDRWIDQLRRLRQPPAPSTTIRN